MKRTRKSAKPVSADAFARLADQGKDVSHFFKGQSRMVQPIQRVNVDVTANMLEELDKAARELNVSRQGGHQDARPASARSALPGATRQANPSCLLMTTLRRSRGDRGLGVGDAMPTCGE